MLHYVCNLHTTIPYSNIVRLVHCLWMIQLWKRWFMKHCSIIIHSASETTFSGFPQMNSKRHAHRNHTGHQCTQMLDELTMCYCYYSPSLHCWVKTRVWYLSSLVVRGVIVTQPHSQRSVLQLGCCQSIKLQWGTKSCTFLTQILNLRKEDDTSCTTTSYLPSPLVLGTTRPFVLVVIIHVYALLLQCSIKM